MSFVMIPEELLEVDISAAQLRALIHIINHTYSSGKYAGCCCLGYQNLADLCYTHKGAAINTLKQLEALGFIEINRRERFNRSNAIKLTLENGYERCRNKSGDYSDNTYERSLNRTDKGSLNRTLGSLNRTEGSLNRTPHIDLKFKNLDLKTKTRACARRDGSLKDTDKYTATGDVAPVLSKPSELARDESARKAETEDWAAKDARMSKLLLRIYPEFKSWYSLFRRSDGMYQINPVSSLIERIMPEKERITSVPAGVAVCNYETPGRGLTKIL